MFCIEIERGRRERERDFNSRIKRVHEWNEEKGREYKREREKPQGD